jgi:LacI family transcriptional regulator
MADSPPAAGDGARPTLDDVARLAGVSLATASRVLSPGKRDPGPDLRDRVLTAARSLSYTTNANAQAIARGDTRIVGLIVSDIIDPYFSTIAAGAIRTADEHGVLTTLADTRRDPRREIDYLSALRGQRARGVIVIGSRVRDRQQHQDFARELAAYRSGGGRILMISQPKLDADTIAIENRAGARDLAVALCGLGYRRFAVLGGPARLLTAADRLAGFKEGLASRAVAPPLVVHGDFTRDAAYSAARRFFAAGPDVECVFAVNDVMAVGAMAAARDAGLRPPEDIGFAGFDDIATLRDVVPALTTVRVPLYEIGVSAMRRVLDPDTAPGVQRVPCEVVTRESTPRLR